MGILSWFGKVNNGKKEEGISQKSDPKTESAEVPGMNGAVEVRKPEPPAVDISVFEFGSVAASADKVTLAGYCPVSDELEPCRWEILPASGSDAPQFRVFASRTAERRAAVCATDDDTDREINP